MFRSQLGVLLLCWKNLCCDMIFNHFYQSHNDALDDHRRIPMVEYQKEYRKLETRHCVTHGSYQYSVGCEKCYEVFCIQCLSGETVCKDGEC